MSVEGLIIGGRAERGAESLDCLEAKGGLAIPTSHGHVPRDLVRVERNRISCPLPFCHCTVHPVSHIAHLSIVARRAIESVPRATNVTSARSVRGIRPIGTVRQESCTLPRPAALNGALSIVHLTATEIAQLCSLRLRWRQIVAGPAIVRERHAVTGQCRRRTKCRRPRRRRPSSNRTRLLATAVALGRKIRRPGREGCSGWVVARRRRRAAKTEAWQPHRRQQQRRWTLLLLRRPRLQS